MHSYRAASALIAVATFLACAPSPRPASSDAAAHAAGAPSLRVGRDSFVSRFTGAPDGYEVHEYARLGAGYRYTSHFAFGAAMERRTEVDFDSTLRVVRAASEWRVGNRAGRGELHYTAGRVRGAVSPFGGAAGPVALDTVLPVRAVDGLALYPLLLSRTWAVGRADTLDLFDSDESGVTRQTLRVVSAEEVAVGAARVPALRGELSTTQLPVTLWVSAARPHRLLRVRSASGESVLVP